jgi:superfamily II DNA or RNA helicase
MSYQQFLESKRIKVLPSGMNADDVIFHPAMKPHQRDVLRWALVMGKAAAFLGTGLGKTLLELQWAENVYRATGKPVLISAPLAVAHQIVREAEKFGFDSGVEYRINSDNPCRIVTTNYDRLEAFDPNVFGGIALDESSILKATDGRTRTRIIEQFAGVPYKLPSSATPAPNDYMELGNHSEFLGVISQTEMLSMFFVHDGGETQKWRLKGHARKSFWEWVATWAVMITKPSDIGYPDEGYALPELRVHHHVIDVDKPSEGMLFAMPASTLAERISARRSTSIDRAEACAGIVKDGQWLIWTNLNSEADHVTRLIHRAEQVSGADKDEVKVDRAIRFASGNLDVLVSKPSIFGHGLNFQSCHQVAFVGVTDSFEQYYQAVRRCWRFGQTKPVDVHIFSASTEGDVIENLQRKEREAEEMQEQMREAMMSLTRENLRGLERHVEHYKTNSKEGIGWKVILGDSCEVMKSLPDSSIDYSVYSPPFASLYTYSNSERDLGNSADDAEFWEHYRYIIAEHWRTHKPGRLVSIHCMNLPTSKVRDGFIGIRDFRGQIIREFEDAGFIYHSEVCIWKDPVTAMQRTKALGLLHKQIRKDSAMSRQGIPDYLVTFRKSGENDEPVSHTHDDFPVSLWQNYASPVWMDINPSDTLQYQSAREHNDEKHICPLQLEVIRRAVKLWSNPNDVVFSPFAGIGSEGHVALQMGRQYLGIELKESYWRQACANLANAEIQQAWLFAEEKSA